MTFNKPTELMKLITYMDKRKSNERKKTITLNFHEFPDRVSLHNIMQCNGHYVHRKVIRIEKKVNKEIIN